MDSFIAVIGRQTMTPMIDGRESSYGAMDPAYKNDDSGEGAFMRPDFSGSLTCQGWGTSRGIKGGSAPLARSYRGPDNVAGPILGQLNPALAVVSRCWRQALDVLLTRAAG